MATRTDTPSPKAMPGKRKRRRVTMTDVAREAGCSQATVSFVLNHTPGIKLSSDTRTRVFETARRLGYAVPASSAPRLLASRGRQIGVLADQLTTSPGAVLAIEGLTEASRASGDVVLVAETQHDEHSGAEIIRTFIHQRLSALVYMTALTRKIELPEPMVGLDMPVFLLNCYTSSHLYPAVVPSETAGGQRSTRHLIEQGHRRIATITGEIWMEAAQDRLLGYRRALATADLPFDPSLVVEGDLSVNSGYDATRHLLALPQPPSAIFCQNDRMAIGCYKALREGGYDIPADMSVLGFGDEEIARYLQPRLTTSILPHRAMGRWIVEQLSEYVPRPGRYPLVKLECPLIERGSVSPHKA